MTSPTNSWSPPPEHVTLIDTDVHVWLARLHCPAATLQSLVRTLDADERARAERFHFQRDRERFIIAHGMLRVILSRYLQARPERLRFCYGQYGKPALDADAEAETLRFNMSHSKDMALYAITRGREVGVDIEYVREDVADEQIAERFFSRREVEKLRSLPASQRTQAFFNCWTRKEAYIKARSEGLSFPLDQFDVSLAPGEPAALLDVRGDVSQARRWSLHDLTPGCGYAAALAVEGSPRQICHWDWTYEDI